MTYWVTRLLVLNVLIFLLIHPGTLVYALLTLFPPAVVGIDQIYVPMMPFRPWTLFTYMFLHAGFWHLFSNMIGLFFFGPRLESKLGAKSFLYLYFLSGLGGAALSFIFSFSSPVVGASAAVYGVLIGFAIYWPRENIYIWGVLPIQARVLATGLVCFSLYSGIAGTGGGVAHFAHIGGLAVGAGYLYWLDRYHRKDRRDFKRKVQYTPSTGSSDREIVARWSSINLSNIHELNRIEVEDLMLKINDRGVRSLSLEERAFLDRLSRK